ncbi:MAG: hypothetical protein IKZ96_01000 [Bacilli bacterium]|nr:hypothetical protein [Bacilli bacterium]
MGIMRIVNCNDYIMETCDKCKGTGISLSTLIQSDVGTICMKCNGKGYIFHKNSNSVNFTQHIPHETEDGKTYYDFRISDELVKLGGVRFVTYAFTKSHRWITSKDFEELQIPSESIVTYDEFLKGKKPLPIESLTCPALISEEYGYDDFNNECCVCYGNCPKEDVQECWDKFYGKATTTKGKKIVLQRKINGKKQH